MRCAAILIAVLSITVSASAEMFITVDGVINPPEYDVAINGTASIGLYADSEMPQGAYFLIITNDGPGSLDYGEIEILYQGDVIIPPDPPINVPGWKSIIEISFADTVEPIEPVIGQLVNNITFQCEGPGDVYITLFDATVEWCISDDQLIHQVPEPGTIALLGMGMLMLKRRR